MRLDEKEMGREIDILSEENYHLRRELDQALEAVDKLLEPAVKSFQLEDGTFSMALTGPAMERLAAVIVGHFKALGPENYFEMTLFDREDPGERYTVTVQKVSAKSPHELRREAEDRVEELEKQLRGA